jgi:hypothetical protein
MIMMETKETMILLSMISSNLKKIIVIIIIIIIIIIELSLSLATILISLIQLNSCSYYLES